jgi:transcriptional regulator with XRE-family HTH domain
VTEPQVTFAGLLRKLRVEAHLTQEELAESSGVRPRTVSDLERGVAVTPHRETVQRLADALDLTGLARAEFEAVARGRPVATRTGSAGAAGVAAATRALPRDITSFTGRQQQLQELMDAASGPGGVVGIHAIGGMAGIGKTAFAVNAAHRLADQFPAGQIFLPLHGHTPGQRPVDPGDALASLLLTIGVPATQIPPDLEARTALWPRFFTGVTGSAPWSLFPVFDHGVLLAGRFGARLSPRCAGFHGPVGSFAGRRVIGGPVRSVLAGL